LLLMKEGRKKDQKKGWFVHSGTTRKNLPIRKLPEGGKGSVVRKHRRKRGGPGKTPKVETDRFAGLVRTKHDEKPAISPSGDARSAKSRLVVSRTQR